MIMAPWTANWSDLWAFSDIGLMAPMTDVETTKYIYSLSRTVYVPSSALEPPPHPLSRKRLCPSPRNQREEGHTRLRGEGVGSQFGRLEKKSFTEVETNMFAKTLRIWWFSRKIGDIFANTKFLEISSKYMKFHTFAKGHLYFIPGRKSLEWWAPTPSFQTIFLGFTTVDSTIKGCMTCALSLPFCPWPRWRMSPLSLKMLRFSRKNLKRQKSFNPSLRSLEWWAPPPFPSRPSF